MGLFSFFKKGFPNNTGDTKNGLSGPTYLEGLTSRPDVPDKKGVWERQLISAAGERQFRIRYYGALHDKHKGLIVGTDFAPSLVYAVEISTGQEILLFDGCRHGYNALFCDTYTADQLQQRPVDNLYVDTEGYDVFEITVIACYGFDYEEEFTGQVGGDGRVELINGDKIPFERVKRDGYDTLQILATNLKGSTFEVVSEELA